MGSIITLPNVLAAITLVSLTAYVLLGGADFGGGVWDLFASGPRRQAQRALVTEAIGPIWEANHVWLVLVVVLLFTCFPSVFSGLAITLHIPLTLMLIGIVLRGSAFTFRTYGTETDVAQRRWGRTFAVASLVTPALLGVCIGAIAAEGVGGALVQLGRGGAESSARAVFIDSWLTPFAIGIGVFTLVLFAFLAAVYLTVEAHDAPLREDFRRRALACEVALFVIAFGVLLLARTAAPRMGAALTTSAWALPFHLATAIAALAALAALWTRRFRGARIAAAAQVTLILWGWALAQYPFLVPPVLTIQGAAAPPRTLRLALWALALGAAVLFPSLAYLFRVFKGRPEAFERLEHGAPPRSSGPPEPPG